MRWPNNMESLVVSLKSAKRLKAAGFPQTTRYAWYSETETLELVDWSREAQRSLVNPAPTAQEIADQLVKPFNVRNLSDGRFYAVGHKLTSGDGDTMAEALAALWLKLHEVQS